MNRITKRAVYGGGAVLASIGAVLTGATVTSAAIDTADEVPGDAVIEVQQVAQDADGGWYSCTVTLDESAIAPVPADLATAPNGAGGSELGAGYTVTASAGVAPATEGAPDVWAEGTLQGAVSIELSAGDLDAMFTGTVPEGAVAIEALPEAVAEAGSVAVEMATEAIELPTPEEIRPGTQDECDALLGG